MSPRRIVAPPSVLVVALSVSACGASTGLYDAPRSDAATPADVATRDVLGRSCGSAADCDDTTWCTHAGCGFTLGVCAARPTRCDGMWSPTCGCDARTWDSPCHAQRAGVSIAASGIACVSRSCATPCAAGTTCVDCGSAGPQCLATGRDCARR